MYLPPSRDASRGVAKGVRAVDVLSNMIAKGMSPPAKAVQVPTAFPHAIEDVKTSPKARSELCARRIEAMAAPVKGVAMNVKARPVRRIVGRSATFLKFPLAVTSPREKIMPATASGVAGFKAIAALGRMKPATTANRIRYL